MSNSLTITARDGSGTFGAYLALPANPSPAPAIIVIQEIFGVNADMRQKCDKLAEAGYVAICPDLFWRQQPNVQLTDKTDAEWQQAFALLQGFNVDLGIDDIEATLAALRAHGRVNGKVGCVGYCLGGKLAYLTATRTSIDASVGYYGIGLEGLLAEATNIKQPVLLHVAELDKYVAPEARDAIIAHFAGHTYVTTHLYKGVDHAFSREAGAHYDAAAATLANTRTRAFFKDNLGL